MYVFLFPRTENKTKMTYEEKIIDDTLKELKTNMREVNVNNTKEYRVAMNKIGSFRFVLLKLYQEGFKQRVYTVK
jgi:hypothetical protein